MNSLWRSFAWNQAYCLPPMFHNMTYHFKWWRQSILLALLLSRLDNAESVWKSGCTFLPSDPQHLAWWNSMSHSLSYNASLLRSSCSFWQSPILVTVRYTIMSSTSSLILECWVYLGISSMYSRKRTGPRTDPWGTPLVTDRALDSLPSITMFCILDDEEGLNPCLLVWRSIPAQSSFYISRSRETLLKALLKSITIALHWFLSLS